MTITGFDTAITMAEAAACENPTWWNEVRNHDADAGYASSVLLAEFIRSYAHQMGVPVSDVWTRIRATGELPI
ncbi:hypothetical protein HUN08_07615 [Gordonia sp. X0973]|uniref:hypothetical protein n=1 Tax=Gordonia sp. X0973 TaxID=2742602 RepID=UPI000F53EDCF|nr:hypothetical protein [Gordonia sp. X0973]QKT07081.1 hypothetical protein HUN08_07615 [Gordonia sp. X0973]